MRKILHFDSPREKYHCDASVISCFDNRFEAAGRKLLKRIGIVQPDPIRIAGGAKSLASPEQEFHRTFVLDQIQKSIRLHGTQRAILILHSDCGAYGGLSGVTVGAGGSITDNSADTTAGTGAAGGTGGDGGVGGSAPAGNTSS